MINIYKRHLFSCLALALFLLCASSCSFLERDPLKMALERYNRETIKTPYVSPAGYAETAKCEDKYCMYTEAYGYFFSAGYDVPVAVDNLFLFPENMKKSNRSNEWLKQLKNKYANGDISNQSDFPPGFLSALNAFRWFEEHGLFKHLEGFESVSTDTVQGGNGPTIIYHFSNHENYKYSGKIHVESDNFISKIEFDSIRFFSPPLNNWNQAKGLITFYNDKKGDRLESIKINHETEKFVHSVYFKTGREIFHHKKLDDSLVFRLMEHKRRPMVYYNQDWNNPFDFEGLDLEEVYSDLGEIDVLNNQFERNAGAPFIKEIKDLEGKYLEIRKSEETYSFVEDKIEEFSTIFD